MEEIDKLEYDYGALEPYIDEETMRIHHGKHFQAYFDNFMKTINGTELEGKDVRDILSDLNKIPGEIRQAVINHGGGYFNHRFFWAILKKDVPFEGKIAEGIKEEFGSFENFKEEFGNAAKTQFGSGWAWLVLDSGKLKIVQSSNQESPISNGMIPLLVIDVWEHAYYLKYQNKRPDYVENFFNVIDWVKVEGYYLENN